MPGNAGPGMHCACQFVPVSVCFGPCWVSCSDKVFCNSCVQREDISHFLLQTPAVLCALLGKVLMMENPRLGSTPGFSASENKMCWWTGCDLCGRWSLQTIQHHCAPCVLGGLFLAGTLQSSGRITVEVLAGPPSSSRVMEAVEACRNLAISMMPLLWTETPAQAARR